MPSYDKKSVDVGGVYHLQKFTMFKGFHGFVYILFLVNEQIVEISGVALVSAAWGGTKFCGYLI